MIWRWIGESVDQLYHVSVHCHYRHYHQHNAKYLWYRVNLLKNLRLTLWITTQLRPKGWTAIWERSIRVGRRWHADRLTCWHAEMLTCWYADMLTCWHADMLTCCWHADDMLMTCCWHAADMLLTCCWHAAYMLLTCCWHAADMLTCWNADMLICWHADTMIW